MLRLALACAWSAVLAMMAAPAAALAAREHYQLVDCAHLPAEAATQVPVPVDAWTRVECRPLGQMLAQTPGWVWRYSGSFTNEVVVAAIMGTAAEAGGGARFFRDMAVSVRNGEEVLELHRDLKQRVSSYAFIAGDDAPRKAYTLRAVNDVLDIITVHFLERSEGDLLAVACTPECRPEHVFLVHKVGG